jgi:hypothetical protein
MIKISEESLEFVRARVEAVKQGVAYDPTHDVVEFAFTATDDLDNAVWFTGDWETTDHGKYFARCLVGPDGDAELDPGVFKVWVRVTDNPEIPVRFAGNVKVY